MFFCQAFSLAERQVGLLLAVAETISLGNMQQIVMVEKVAAKRE